MAEKTAYSRIVNKHDIEANWALAEHFTPKKGEIIVYDADANHSYERFKIGDGTTLVNALPFATDLKNLGIYIGATEPTDPNIKIWINTAEEGTGVVPILPRITTINLTKNGWTGSASPYSQTITIPTVTAATKIDLLPTVAQITSLQDDDIALMAENTGNGVKIYSFGGKPTADMTMQAQLMEVAFV